MKMTRSPENIYLQLLSSLDFEKVLSAVADIFISEQKPTALAILIWDQDLEAVSDKFFFGPDGESLGKAAEAYASLLEEAENFEDAVSGVLSEEDLDLPESLTVNYLRIQDGADLIAAVLLSGSPVDSAELRQEAVDYPLYEALANAWEIREIKRENERLRNRYEDLEERNANLEDQTRKLIQDLTVKDALRFRTMERDKWIYEISSAVRSSVEIQQVLQNAVDNLGRRFELSRCLILRPQTQTNALLVYEYHNSGSESVQDKFFSPAGQEFVGVIMSKTAPCELIEGEPAGDYGFDTQFLQSFGFLSALIIPLIMRDKTIGAIFLQDCKMPRPWSIDDLTFFGALADQLSVAVENADLHEERKLQAVTDGLTGIANRRHFNECYFKEFERARRYEEPLTLAVFDLDFLKKINDTFGHVAGDDAIKAIASVLSRSSRSTDLAARYGGEEFCLLLPKTTLEEAAVIVERVRRLISETELSFGGKISASIGMANFPLHSTDPDELFKFADEALYKAKQNGRNQVRVHGE